MSAFNRNKVTRNGALLSSATLSGSELTFTKIVIGDGTYIGDLEEAEGLVSPKIDLQIKAIVSNGNKVTLTTSLLPKDITSDFYWREVGVFAKGADDVEVLFMYATAEDTSFISTNSLDEKTISLGIIVSNAENVTAIIDDGLVYATQADIESHNISATAHQDIREAIANIDLTSVTTKVSQEHELTRARVNNQHAETREHITNETNRCVNNTDDQAENIKVHVTSQHETTRNTIRSESVSNANNLNNAKNEIVSNVESAKNDILGNMKPGGDVCGKDCFYENIFVTTGNAFVQLKSYTNEKGGVVRVSIVNNNVSSSYNIVVDGVTKATNFMINMYESLEIPFSNSFSISVSHNNTGAVDKTYSLQYFINK